MRSVLKYPGAKNRIAGWICGFIPRHDVYLDPTYLHGTRKNHLYRCEMDDGEHEDLLKVLVRHPGKILLSGYENEMYNDYLAGWHKARKKTRAEKGRPRTETLWMNYENDGQMNIYDFLK